jgi:hypothetical protein
MAPNLLLPVERAFLSDAWVTENNSFHRAHKIWWRETQAGFRSTASHRSWDGQSTKIEEDFSKSYMTCYRQRKPCSLCRQWVMPARSLTLWNINFLAEHRVKPARYWHNEISVSALILCDASSFLETMKYHLPPDTVRHQITRWHFQTTTWLECLSKMSRNRLILLVKTQCISYNLPFQ